MIVDGLRNSVAHQLCTCALYIFYREIKDQNKFGRSSRGMERS